MEYWKEETLKDIGNSLGVFIKVAEETKTRRYTSYARICVQMHLTRALADSISLFHDDFEWIQPLDYEHIPFRCWKCHEHGHIFRDCPLNSQPKSFANESSKDSKGFIKIPNHRRHAKKNHTALESPKNPVPQNRFIILSSPNPEENQSSDLHTVPSPPSSPLTLKAPRPPSASDPSSLLFSTALENIVSDFSLNPSSLEKLVPEMGQQSSSMELDVVLALSLHDNAYMEDQNTPTIMEEDPENVSLEGLDILKLETACKKKEYNSIPPWQIDRLEGVLTKVQHNKCLGIQAGSPWDGKKILKETKKKRAKNWFAKDHHSRRNTYGI